MHLVVEQSKHESHEAACSITYESHCIVLICKAALLGIGDFVFMYTGGGYSRAYGCHVLQGKIVLLHS